MAKVAKVLCLHCDNRMEAGRSFCPSCEHPTIWATHDERVAWELEQYRKVREQTVEGKRSEALVPLRRVRRSDERQAPAASAAAPAAVPHRPTPAPRTNVVPLPAARAPADEPSLRRRPLGSLESKPFWQRDEKTFGRRTPEQVVAEVAPLVVEPGKAAAKAEPAPAAVPAETPAASAQAEVLLEEQLRLLRELIDRVGALEAKLAATSTQRRRIFRFLKS